jgi:hypothetical protein
MNVTAGGKTKGRTTFVIAGMIIISSNMLNPVLVSGTACVTAGITEEN